MRARAGACLLAACAAALVAGRAPGEAGPPCVAEARLSASAAVVGQQLVYSVRVLRRPDVSSADWIVPPAFPSFRAEWLPGRPGDTRVWQNGTPYLVYEERHALFPVRSGRLAIPGARLLCELHAFPGEERRGAPAELAGAAVEVSEPPEAGRPPGFAGLVGRLRVRRELEPASARLGEALRLSVVLEGPANLWDAPEPSLDGLEQADVFAHPPALSFDAAEELRVRRTFVWDVVPRRSGRLELPAYEVTSFDPIQGRYESVVAPPLAVEVGAPPEPVSPAAAPAGPPVHAAATGSRGALRHGAVALLLAAAVGAAWLALAARRRRSPASRAVERALDEAAAARASGARDAEAAALARALRSALALHLPETRARTPEELSAEAPSGEARSALSLLAELETARFAPGGAAPDVASVRRVARELLRARAATRRR